MTDAFSVLSIDTIMLSGAVLVTGAFSALITYALTGKGVASLVQGFTMIGAISLCLAAATYVANN